MLRLAPIPPLTGPQSTASQPIGAGGLHPTVSGLTLQNRLSGTPALHARQADVSARQQNVGSQNDESLHP